jgi:aryl-alcohol dehydrogenase-like predicted oxidoreductase
MPSRLMERQVERRALGATGQQVSVLGFGCQEVGGGYGDIEEAEFARAVHRALDLGITLFDTAEAYGFGASEEALGRALRGRRDEAIISTKFGTGYQDRPNFRDGRAERVRSSIDDSLRRLQTDHVDIYNVHWPDRATPFEETMGALDELVRDGKIRFVGLSNFTVGELDACMAVRRVDAVQYVHGLFDRRIERDVLPWCVANDVGFVGYGSLAYGLLSGTLAEDHAFPADDWRSKTDKWGVMAPLFEHLFGPGRIAENVAVVDAVSELAATRGLTVAQLALRWATDGAGVTAALVGCRTVAEVEADVEALGGKLDAADRDAIDAVFAEHGVDPRPDYWIERGM